MINNQVLVKKKMLYFLIQNRYVNNFASKLIN